MREREKVEEGVREWRRKRERVMEGEREWRRERESGGGKEQCGGK